MINRTQFLASAAIACLLSTQNPAAAENLYVAVEGGINEVSDWQYVPFGTAGGMITGIHRPFNDTKFDSGWSILASVGVEFSSGIRTELEVGYRETDVDRVVFNPGSSNLEPNAALSALTIMANALYEVPLTDRLAVHIGAGAGAASVNYETGAGGPAGWGVHVEDSQWCFAYQGIVGAEFSLTSDAAIFVNYRRTTLEMDDLRFPLYGSLWHPDHLTSTTISLGLKYDFGPTS